MAQAPKALRIDRIGLPVADLPGTCAFYEHRLGFRRTGSERREGAAFAALTGIADVTGEVIVLQLGGQTVELVAFTPPGLPYPAERSAADPWFQHFAVVAADMGAAYAALGPDAAPISTGGPQQLPPATGSVIAYKYRDPEGHPLELSWFPPATAGPPWRDPPPGAVFLGVDHSAIAVADIDASLAFYVGGLGMEVVARQVNSGPTQARLDGFAGAEVEIVALAFAGGGPHLELLAYRGPKSGVRGDGPAVNDIAATRLLLEVQGIEDLVERPGADLVSDGVVDLGGGLKAALVRDPDRHLLELHEGPEN